MADSMAWQNKLCSAKCVLFEWIWRDINGSGVFS